MTHTELINPADFLLVVCNVPNHELAEQIASDLVERQLAACVNILPGIQSVYRWQGEIQRDTEVQLQIKTRLSHYPAVQQAILDLHTYTTPEILGVALNSGLPAYLSWLKQETQLL